MTVHLYYDDSYARDFTARILGRRDIDGRPAAILDRTIFYPNSGGQPCDTGMLGSARVVDVREEPDGTILHILDSPLPAGPVAGSIDWERRFDHMQQHTGQHILSQAFLQCAGAATLSFHLGQETSTIDIELPVPDESAMREVEERAARIVFDNRPVHTLAVEREEQVALGVRKESNREGTIRVIDIEGFDRSPCGGTHVHRTGEVGVISILGFERYKGGTRVEFVCGRRVLERLRTDTVILRQLGKLFSSHFLDLPLLAEKLFKERNALLHENARLRDQILEMEAQEMCALADKTEGVTIIRRSFEGRTVDSVKVLAQKATVRSGVVAILAAVQETAQIVVARSSDVPGSCGVAIKLAAGKLSGRGGGREELAQAGGIPRAILEDWFDALESYFRESLAKHERNK